jgi:hypothetical protein
MLAYKLLKRRKDGSVGSLFINAAARLEPGVWMEAEAHRRAGFAFRPGWHCLVRPSAPHLKMQLSNGEQREWWVVEIEDYDLFQRPEEQGGCWYLAQRMKLLGRFEQEQPLPLAA